MEVCSESEACVISAIFARGCWICSLQKIFMAMQSFQGIIIVLALSFSHLSHKST